MEYHLAILPDWPNRHLTYVALEEKYGESKQTQIAMEEFAELIQATSKAFRSNEQCLDNLMDDTLHEKNKDAKDNLISEMADAIIMMEQIMRFRRITHCDLVDAVERKMKRTETNLDRK